MKYNFLSSRKSAHVRQIPLFNCIIISLLFFLFRKRLLHRTVNILRQFIDADDTHPFLTRPRPRVEESTDEEIQKDPLIVLRCDRRVFRCPPLFDIMLRVLRGYMTASRGLLNHHILSNPLSGSEFYLLVSFDFKFHNLLLFHYLYFIP